MARPSRRLLAVFAATIAVLWIVLVPPWDGFDEAQHYSYVQTLAQEGRLPVFGQTPITQEIWSSLWVSPVSPPVQENYPMLRTFDDFRARKRPDGPEPTPPDNYEAHQAPLAYMALAPFEWALQKLGAPVAWRLRLLRLIALASAMAVFWRILGGGPLGNAGFFVVLTTQMFLATCGHVANDWLAIPLFVSLYLAAERRERAAIPLLTAGLLTKAYFLAVVPAVAWRYREHWRWLLGWSVIPAVWYGRNLWLYGNLSGMQEQKRPLPPEELLAAAWGLPWLESLGETFRGALWLGNNSFLQWSVWQVNLAMAGLVAALWLAVRSNPARRLWLAAYAGSYCAALLYAAAQSNAFTKGAATAASPWYATPLWILVIVLVFTGRTPWAFRGIVAAWTYWFTATLWFRLIPWYAGVMDGPATVGNLARWYGTSIGQVRSELGDGLLLLSLLATGLCWAAGVAVDRDLRTAGNADTLRKEQCSRLPTIATGWKHT